MSHWALSLGILKALWGPQGLYPDLIMLFLLNALKRSLWNWPHVHPGVQAVRSGIALVSFSAVKEHSVNAGFVITE